MLTLMKMADQLDYRIRKLQERVEL